MKKNEIIKKVVNIEFVPDIELKKYDIERAPSFAIKNLSTLGSTVKPLTEIINSVSNPGGSGLYYVNTYGKQMFKSNGKFIGSLKNLKGKVGGGQARLTRVVVDPVTLATSCMIFDIESKLNKIETTQKEIIDFLIMKEESEIKGNIISLTEVLNEYKYNIDNEQYKNNTHILVQSIKNEAHKSILLSESILSNLLHKKEGLHFDGKVDEYLKDSIENLNELQLGIYQYSFASFLEILLLENFDDNYINAVLNNINNYQLKYIENNTKVKEKIVELSESSIPNKLMSGVSKASLDLGKLIEKTPLNKTNINEKLIKQSEEIKNKKNKNVNKKIKLLFDDNINEIEPFVNTLEAIKLINNKEYNIMFDEENVYLDLKHNKVN